MNVELTKAQEVGMMNAWVATLPPGSYLAAIMKETAPLIEQAIANDFCVIPLKDIMAQKVIAQNELQTLQTEVQRTKQIGEGMVRELERRSAQARSEMEELQAIARRLSSMSLPLPLKAR